MTTLSNRLLAFFASDLRRAGPLWVVAGAAGAALDPVWAQTAAGTLATGVGGNLVASLLYDLVKPEQDDAAREGVIHLQQARKGYDTPPHINTEIADIQTQIDELRGRENT